MRGDAQRNELSVQPRGLSFLRKTKCATLRQPRHCTPGHLPGERSLPFTPMPTPAQGFLQQLNFLRVKSCSQPICVSTGGQLHQMEIHQGKECCSTVARSHMWANSEVPETKARRKSPSQSSHAPPRATGTGCQEGHVQTRVILRFTQRCDGN